MLKTYSLFIAVAYTVALTWVSVINLKNVTDVNIDASDKLLHFLAYALLTYFWYIVCYTKFYVPHIKALIISCVCSITFGIIIEAIQGICTTYRAFDVYDALANTAGALLMAVMLHVKAKLQVKKG